MANGAVIAHQPSGKGDRFTASLKTPPPPGCTFEVWVDDRRVEPGDRFHGLRAVGFSATGTATFEATSDAPNATITLRVRCPGTDNADHQVNVGKGWQHPPREAFNPDRGRPLPPPWDADVAGPHSGRQPH